MTHIPKIRSGVLQNRVRRSAPKEISNDWVRNCFGWGARGEVRCTLQVLRISMGKLSLAFCRRGVVAPSTDVEERYLDKLDNILATSSVVMVGFNALYTYINECQSMMDILQHIPLAVLCT